MIKSVNLQNFQSHKNTFLEFDPGVNIIIGSSRSGKTAVLRALNWCRYNKPAGIAYNSYWNRNESKQPIKQFSSVVEFEEDTFVERVRGQKFNGYDANGIELGALGQDVPEDVEKLFNMQEVNMQKQFDAPFLISESPAEVARFFNRVIKLDKIDIVLSKAQSLKNSTNQAITANIKLQTELNQDINAMAWVGEVEPLVKAAEQCEERILKNKTKLSDLSFFVGSIKTLLSEIGALPTGLDGALLDIVEAEKVESKLSKNIIYFDNCVEVIEKIEELVKISGSVPDNLDSISVDMTEALKIDSRIEVRVDSEYSIGDLITSIKKQREELLSIDGYDFSVIEGLMIEFDDTVAKLDRKKDIVQVFINHHSIATLGFHARVENSKFIEKLENQLPNICPTCGQSIEVIV